MGLPKDLNSREHTKFREGSGGTTLVAVTFEDAFNIGSYDYIDLTYVSGGNGDGEIETAVYKTGGSTGTTVAILTLAYNASNEISSVTKT